MRHRSGKVNASWCNLYFTELLPGLAFSLVHVLPIEVNCV
jgi:hypothetical protein